MTQSISPARLALFSSDELRSRGVSPLVAKAFRNSDIPTDALILDLPCGYGRHSIWLADLGYRVLAADIDAARILSFTSLSESMPENHCQGMVLDANSPLPLPRGTFDAVVITDFVNPRLLAGVAPLLRNGGLLVYQTMSGRGGNWRELPERGQAAQMLSARFDIIHCSTRPAGPKDANVETVSLFGLLRGPRGS